ncbi:MAG TPA: hypothetical protein VIL31_02715 [Cyclobacteriaceae bacterium]|jgi:hypothetical protein
MIRALTAAFLLFVATATYSQRLHIGSSIGFMNPVKDLGRAYERGFRINANLEYDVPGIIAFVGEAGWNHWKIRPMDGLNLSDTDVVHVTGGLKVNVIGPLYAEGRTGYYFGDFDRFVLIPAAGLRLRRFDVNIGYQLLNDIQYVDTRVGIFWARSR